MIKSQKLTVKIEKAVTQRVSDCSDCDLSSVVILMCLKIRESRWGILSQHRFIDFHQSLSYFSELMSLDAVRCQFAKSLLWAHAQITSAGNISDATFQMQHFRYICQPCNTLVCSCLAHKYQSCQWQEVISQLACRKLGLWSCTRACCPQKWFSS